MNRTRFALLTALLCLTFVAGLSPRSASADQCDQCFPNYIACRNAAPNDPVWVQACLNARSQCVARYCR
jgi:hypothetical protein